MQIVKTIKYRNVTIDNSLATYPEKILNPGFEISSNGISPDNWTTWYGTPLGTFEIKYPDIGQDNIGKSYSIKFNEQKCGGDDTTIEFASSQLFSLDNTKTYKFSGYVKLENAQNMCTLSPTSLVPGVHLYSTVAYLDAYNNYQGKVLYAMPIRTGTFGWSRFVTLITPEMMYVDPRDGKVVAGSVDLLLGNCTGKVYFDNLSYKETDEKIIPTGIISGKVIDSVTKRGIYKADVSPGVYITTTDSYGYYSIKIPEGTYTMIISRINYNTKTFTVNVSTKTAITLNVELTPTQHIIG